MPSFLVAAVLQAVVSQRLVKTICNDCRTPYSPTIEELMLLGLNPEDAYKHTFFYGKGCEKCRGGYRGRTAIYEFLNVTSKIKEMITGNASTEEIAEVARLEGMKTLRQSGIEKVFSGITTIEEVIKYTSEL